MGVAGSINVHGSIFVQTVAHHYSAANFLIDKKEEKKKQSKGCWPAANECECHIYM